MDIICKDIKINRQQNCYVHSKLEIPQIQSVPYEKLFQE